MSEGSTTTVVQKPKTKALALGRGQSVEIVPMVLKTKKAGNKLFRFLVVILIKRILGSVLIESADRIGQNQKKHRHHHHHHQQQQQQQQRQRQRQKGQHPRKPTYLLLHTRQNPDQHRSKYPALQMNWPG
jgi:hypothetical protein